MMIPVGALTEFTSQLANSLKKIRESAGGKGRDAGSGGDVDAALENL